MRGTIAKQLRRMVYEDKATKPSTTKYSQSGYATPMVALAERRRYLQAKKDYKR